MGQMVELVSPNASLMLLVEPPSEVVDSAGNKRVTDKGTRVRFVNGMARVDEAVFAKVAELPIYTGDGGRKRVFLKADAMARGPVGVQVAHGQLGTGGSGMGPLAPLPDWDKIGAVKLVKMIREDQVPGDPEAMLDYERTNRRRESVMRELAIKAFAAPKRAEPAKAEVDDPGTPPTVVVPDGTEGI